MMKWLKGSLKSRLMWIGAVLMLSPTWWPLAEPLLADLFGVKTAQYATQIIGLIVVILRLDTNKAVKDK